MKIFVVMTGPYRGSISVNYSLIDIEKEEVIASGTVEKIGQDRSFFTCTARGKTKNQELHVSNCTGGVKLAVESLVDLECGCIKDFSELSAVAHRVVHGGEMFVDHCYIDEKVVQDIRECIPLAPLHNQYNLIGIETCRQMMPDVPQVAIFDTCFHQTIPDYAYIYGLPFEYYQKYGIRRYGFHGNSHKFASERAAHLLGKPPEGIKLVTCHLGNGASTAAIKDGKSLDTSMGFTPLEGLIMPTRSGDIDAAIIPIIMEKEGFYQREIDGVLNKRSGLLGISGISGNVFDLLDAMKEGSYRAKLAIEAFCYRLKKYICAYAGTLGGLDAIVFTGGIGENSPEIRSLSLSDLEFIGISLDEEKNKITGKEGEISKKNSKVKIFVVPTNEELMMAREARKVVEREMIKEAK